jgi:zinc protease
LDLLALILGIGDSSRLERRIRSEKGLVYSVGSYAYTPMEPGLFLIQATLDPRHLDAALGEILKEGFRIGRQGVASAELEKARINVEADFLQGKETMQGKARNLGYFQIVFGDIHQEKVYLEAIRRVTPEDIQRVARRYLTEDRLTVALLIPEDTPVEIPTSHLESIAREALGEAARQPRGSDEGRGTPRVHREVLENGLKLLVKEERGVPTVSIQAVFLGGSRFERPENAGVSAFLARLLTRGTRSRSADQLALEEESMAGALSGYSGRNSVGAKAEFMSRFFPQAMELLSDVLLNPAFDPDEMEKERDLLLAAVRREKDQPTRLAFQIFRQTLFGKHPYGFRQSGTEQSLKALTRKDIQAFYERVILPDNGVVAIVGDVTIEEARQWTRRYLGGWAGSAFRMPTIPQEPPLLEPRIVRRASPKQQVHILLGFPGTKIGAPDQYPLEILDTVLSGQGGRLFRELRDREGLAYSVTSFSQVGLDPGYFGTYIGTAPRNLDRAVEGLKRELKRVTQEEIRPEELDRAKQYIVGRYEIGLQTHAAQALTMALDERYGLGFDYGSRYIRRIQDVTREDVLRAARKYIHSDRYVLVMVGPPQP